MKWEFKFSMEDECVEMDTVYKAIEVSFAERVERAGGVEDDAKIYLEGNTLRLLLRAEDVPSLRAKVNTWLRLIKVCLDVLEALKAFNGLKV